MVDQTEQRGRGLRVLVVDDNADAADSLCMLLHLWGHEARVAYDGRQALEVAAAFLPDCLILDIGLPGLNGYELARAIRGLPNLHAARLIALSAYSGAEHIRRTEEVGFDHRLVKPADPAEVQRLLNMLREILDAASRTEHLVRRNAELAQETNDLLGEAKSDLKEVCEEIKEVKEEIREVKEEIRDVRASLDRERQSENESEPR